jgi:hypothetical protein
MKRLRGALSIVVLLLVVAAVAGVAGLTGVSVADAEGGGQVPPPTGTGLPGGGGRAIGAGLWILGYVLPVMAMI